MGSQHYFSTGAILITLQSAERNPIQRKSVAFHMSKLAIEWIAMGQCTARMAYLIDSNFKSLVS